MQKPDLEVAVVTGASVFGPAASVDEVSLADWEATLPVNLTGAMLCAAAAVRAMKAESPQGRRIINNGSIAAHSPRPRPLPAPSPNTP